jgi:hypothetical protein
VLECLSAPAGGPPKPQLQKNPSNLCNLWLQILSLDLMVDDA